MPSASLPPQALLAYPFLRTLSAPSQKLFSARSRLRIFRRGARVIDKGDEVGGMYFVIAGVLRVFTISAEGAEASLYRVRAGQSCLLAASALFSDMRYPAWVVAESREVRLLTTPAAVFRQLHEEEPALRNFTLNALSERVFDLMSSLEELSLDSLDRRLKSLLLRRAGANWVIEATHDELATDLATAREVVSRRLIALKKQGVIRTRRGRIQVLKPECLGQTRPDPLQPGL